VGAPHRVTRCDICRLAHLTVGRIEGAQNQRLACRSNGGRRIAAIDGETHMQRTLLLAGMLLMMVAVDASADDKEALITLDKQWGEAVGKGDKTAAAKFVADNSISVDDKGMKNKQQQIADIQAAPAGEKYEAVDYKVTLINPDTAIMTHSTKGADAHYSLHVWSRKGGTWQVIATSTTAAARE
jgi:hypothetical protein